MSFRAALLSLMVLPLAADDLHFGVQGQAVKASSGSLRTEADDKTGTSLGAHLDWNPDGGSVLRFRADFLRFKEREGATPTDKLRLEARSLGTDYLYYWRGRPEGGYVALGVALTEWRFQETGVDDRKKQLLNGSLGFGTQFSRFMGVELRYTLSNLDAETRFRPSFFSAQVLLHF